SSRNSCSIANILRPWTRLSPRFRSNAGGLTTLVSTMTLHSLGDLLHDCVHAGASVSFVLPFSSDDAAAFWRDKVLPAVEAARCRARVARRDGQIAGTVQLDLATPPNQPHRGEIKKLLVHPSARRFGIARALMVTIEEEARDARRTLLTLDTASAAAEQLYAS